MHSQLLDDPFQVKVALQHLRYLHLLLHGVLVVLLAKEKIVNEVEEVLAAVESLLLDETLFDRLPQVVNLVVVEFSRLLVDQILHLREDLVLVAIAFLVVVEARHVLGASKHPEEVAEHKGDHDATNIVKATHHGQRLHVRDRRPPVHCQVKREENGEAGNLVVAFPDIGKT